MGRLRGKEDDAFFQDINEEVYELFGNDDFFLYVLNHAASVSGADPLYSEPSANLAYTKYPVTGFVTESDTAYQGTEQGEDIEISATGFFSRKIFEKTGVPRHGSESLPGNLNFITAGDVLEVYARGETTFYDVLGSDRKGYVNDSDSWTYYECLLKRRESFAPERKTDPTC